MSYISSYCRLTDYNVSVNGTVIYSDEKTSTEDWAKQLYKNMQIDYPKFYKMDVLSKFAFLGTEIIRANNAAINKYNDDEIALLFSNCNSSADSDIKFQNSYQKDKVPSPALFVYTLPNILIGEIAIRNKWYGENMFFIRQKFDGRLFEDYCSILLAAGLKACLCGWIDVLNEKRDVFLFFVEASENKSGMTVTEKTLDTLYKL
ncbi:MAG: hypothetical protein JJE25_09810 [Bacteroidia bacterium]|nr:hypothetical protein [Bacteroidia bacterium]